MAGTAEGDVAARGGGKGVHPVALLAAAHFPPTVAVTTVVAVLAVAADRPLETGIFVTAAVFFGQLTIGWGNDLVDAGRDRQVGRTDKPLATGELSARLVIGCLVVAAVACVVLSFAAGWRSALVHLFVGVACGHAYNLWLKSTPVSWLPYAIAFGSLPWIVWLAGPDPGAPAWWMVLAASALGVAAHFLNALPDLADDTATGVRGLPQRIGAMASRVVATLLLVGASAVAVIGPGSVPPWAWVVLGVTVVLAEFALFGKGKIPFYAAIAIALIDVVLLAVRS